ncbi:MAG: AbrB family transcriptional regulator, partial [Granulosicoccus sp.]|nr:AbrB family transcriptional regulator [Granulosicoccus sp.]
MHKPLASQISTLITTCLIALLAGWILYQLHFPAPYLLGSLFGVWIAGGCVKPLRQRVGIPRWFVKPILLGLGVSMGAMFTPEIAGSVFQWWPTVISMIGATVFATAAGFW